MYQIAVPLATVLISGGLLMTSIDQKETIVSFGLKPVAALYQIDVLSRTRDVDRLAAEIGSEIVAVHGEESPKLTMVATRMNFGMRVVTEKAGVLPVVRGIDNMGSLVTLADELPERILDIAPSKIAPMPTVRAAWFRKVRPNEWTPFASATALACVQEEKTNEVHRMWIDERGRFNSPFEAEFTRFRKFD